METLPLSPHFFKEVFIRFFHKSLFLAPASPSPPPHLSLSAHAFPDEQHPPGLPLLPSTHGSHGTTARLVTQLGQEQLLSLLRSVVQTLAALLICA